MTVNYNNKSHNECFAIKLYHINVAYEGSCLFGCYSTDIPNINIVHNMTAEWNWELPVYLSCSADAYPPASHYKWYREEDNTNVLSDQQNFTVQPQNPGTYYCTAGNSIGNSRSKHIELFVSEYEILHLQNK